MAAGADQSLINEGSEQISCMQQECGKGLAAVFLLMGKLIEAGCLAELGCEPFLEGAEQRLV